MNKQRFSIRKYKKIAASVLLGIFISANDVYANQKEIPVQYQYVSETELSNEQKSQILSHLPSKPTSTTLYVVYRKNSPIQLKPSIATGDLKLFYLSMIAFVVVGYQLVKDKNKTKKVVTSVIAITTLGTSFVIPVKAFTELAQYNEIHHVLDTQPDGKIVIPGYEFVGYLYSNQNIFTEENVSEIEFKEVIELDNQLDANQRQVVIQGKNGKEIIKNDYYVLNGEKVVFNTVTNKQQPITQIVKVGTKTVVENGITTEFLNKSFDEIIEFDSTKWADEIEVLQEGIEGKEIVKKDASGTIIEVITLVAKQDRKVIRGSKPLLGIETEKETKDIDFEIEYIYDDSKYRDEEIVEVIGEKGIQEVIATYQTFKGVKQGNPYLQINEVKPKVNQIIRVGTKEIEDYEVVKEQKVTPFSEKVVLDENKWEDEEVVSEVGQNLVEEIITTYHRIHGVRQSNPQITTNVVTPLKDRVVVKGTKPIVGEIVERKEEEIPFDIQYIYDNTKYVDEEIIEQVGQLGKKEIITTYQTTKGVKQNILNVIENELTPKQDRIVRVGTKPIQDVEIVRERKVVTFSEEIILDNQLWEDEEQIIHAGTNGLEEVITKYQLVRGVKQDNPEITVNTITPVQNRVVRKGTKPINSTEVEKEVQVIPYDIEYVYDSTKYNDEEIVEVQGQEGKNEIVKTYQTVKGIKQGTPQITTNILVPKINRKIIKGTRLREKPKVDIVTINSENITVSTVVKEDTLLKKSLKFGTTITENSRTLENKKYRLLKGNEEISTGNLVSEIELNNLEYNVEYTLEVSAEYVEDGSTEKIQDTQKFILTIPRKIEIKDVDRYELVKYENGKESIIIALDEIPAQLNTYFVRIHSDRFKSILLPIQSITEENNQYKVLTNIPDLVENRNGYENGHDFYIAKKATADGEVYTSFASLIEAMRLNPTGTFKIGNTLSASEITLPSSAESYYGSEEFRGTLIGENNGETYSIQDLKYPLFSKLNNARIQKLDLKNVDINLSQSNVAALAKTITSSNINDVAVNGKIRGLSNLGGLVAQSITSTITNVRMEGLIETTTALDINSDVGGLVGYMNGGTLSKGYTDATIRMYGTRGGSRAGALVGRAGDGNARINTGYAKGIVENTGYGGQIGGLVGSLWWSGALDNVVSEVSVINGNIIYGDAGDRNARITRVYTVNNKASGQEHAKVSSIDENQVEAIVNGYGIDVSLTDSDSILENQPNEITYTHLKYRNAEKFTPFYLKAFIENQGDKLEDLELLNKEIISIKPLKDEQIVVANHIKEEVNAILVHFKDGTIKKYDVVYNEDSKSYLPEYTVTDLGIVYTVDSLTFNSSISNNVLNSFKSVEYFSDELAKKINAYAESEVNALVNGNTTIDQARVNVINDKMSRLYLEDSFNDIKMNLDAILPKLLQTDKMIAADNDVIKKTLEDKLIENKEYILMALTYLSRWYNIDFANTNIKELAIYHQDFYGKDIETIDFLIQFGKLGYNDLRLRRNINTYKTVFAPNNDKTTLFDYFDDLRTKFTNTDANTWFKQTSKAYLKEAVPLSDPNINVNIYDKMTKQGSTFTEMVLPLLTAKEGIYAISSMNTILFGMFDRYMNMDLKNSDIQRYNQEIERVKTMVDRTTIWHRDHYDFWYRIVRDDLKSRLERNLVSLDGYSTDRGWRSLTNPNQAVKDFFGPIERLYNSNGSGAYANGSVVHFVVDKALDQYGNSVFTHEMVHNNDGYVYFNGSGRRNRLGGEYFALGLLQAPSSHNQSSLGINTIFDFSAQKNDPNRVHALSPNRYQTREDLKQYFERLFDVLYTLEYAEAEVILGKTEEEKKRLLLQIETYMNGHLPGNRRKEIMDGVVLNSIHDLVDNNIISRRGYGVGDKDGYGFTTNGYYSIWMFDPIYSAGENPEASGGDIMFRRMAYELLANYGWEQGFVPYVSTQLETPQNRVVSDPVAFRYISNGEYANMAEFKKAMYDKRYNQREKLKTVTIRWNNQDVVIDSYDKIKSLIQESTTRDLTQSRAVTGTLKHLIFSAYLRSTDDFRDSIYNEN